MSKLFLVRKLFGVHDVFLGNIYKRKIKLKHMEGNIQPGLTYEKAERNTKFSFSTMVFTLGVNFPFLCSPSNLGDDYFLFYLNNKLSLSFPVNKIHVPVTNFNGCLFHCVCFYQLLTDGHLYIYINLYIDTSFFCSLQCFEDNFCTYNCVSLADFLKDNFLWVELLSQSVCNVLILIHVTKLLSR